MQGGCEFESRRPDHCRVFTSPRLRPSAPRNVSRGRIPVGSFPCRMLDAMGERMIERWSGQRPIKDLRKFTKRSRDRGHEP